jgi:ABC-type glycerol-3-phosphate transport system substrate-binding protein
VAIALSSGSGTDAFNGDSPLVASCGRQGALLPLDKYYTKANVDDIIKKSEREIATYEGRMISAPRGSSSVGLFVDTDLFKAAGLKIPGPIPNSG